MISWCNLKEHAKCFCNARCYHIKTFFGGSKTSSDGLQTKIFVMNPIGVHHKTTCPRSKTTSNHPQNQPLKTFGLGV